MRKFLLVAGFAGIVRIALLAQVASFPVTINVGPDAFAYDMSLTTPAGGVATYVWDSYHDRAEHILARSVMEGKRSRIQELSPGAGTYYHPVVVATGPASGQVFWMHLDGSVWRIASRSWRGENWTSVADVADNAMLPSATAVGNQVVLAWEDCSGPREQIQARVWDGQKWSASFSVSDAAVSSRRAALTATPSGDVWAFWDSYDGKDYGVYGRQIRPRLGSIERLSPTGRNSLNVSAASLSDGTVAAAWVSTRDVETAGIFDHWDTLQVAVHRQGKWTLTMSGGQPDIADLRFSLLPRMVPKPQLQTTYYGRQRQPMLAADGSGLWLLWEHKMDARNPGSEPGELLGKRLENGEWSSPAVLHQGLVDYRIASEANAQGGRIAIAGRNTENFYSSLLLDFKQAQKSANDPYTWSEWRPAHLPLHPGAARESILLDGKRYFLYWGDLHVHTRLSSDAEGEIDEMMNYARDKVQIDVIAATDNANGTWMRRSPDVAFADHPLTPSQYAIGMQFADRATDPGKFVALRSWEWSQSYDNRQPNHRNVLFPGTLAPIVRDNENGSDFQNLCDVVEAAGGIMTAHHDKFDLVNRPCDANIEVASGWDVYFAKPAKIHSDLSAGFKVGFVATSDGHRRDPGLGGGLTGIYLTELTREAVIDALRQHRVFATTGTRVMLDARANGKFMGEDVISNGDVNLELKIQSPRPLQRIVLIRDGDVIHEEAGRARSTMTATFLDHPSPGFHWYYWRVELEGETPSYPGNVKVAEGNLAWTSPHRVIVRPGN